MPNATPAIEVLCFAKYFVSCFILLHAAPPQIDEDDLKAIMSVADPDRDGRISMKVCCMLQVCFAVQCVPTVVVCSSTMTKMPV